MLFQTWLQARWRNKTCKLAQFIYSPFMNWHTCSHATAENRRAATAVIELLTSFSPLTPLPLLPHAAHTPYRTNTTYQIPASSFVPQDVTDPPTPTQTFALHTCLRTWVSSASRSSGQSCWTQYSEVKACETTLAELVVKHPESGRLLLFVMEALFLRCTGLTSRFDLVCTSVSCALPLPCCQVNVHATTEMNSMDTWGQSAPRPTLQRAVWVSEKGWQEIDTNKGVRWKYGRIRSQAAFASVKLLCFVVTSNSNIL